MQACLLSLASRQSYAAPVLDAVSTLARPGAVASSAEARGRNVGAVAHVPGQILLVDAGLGLCAMLAVLLERHCHVEWAGSVPPALRSLTLLAPDLVVLDIGLRGLDGWSFVHALKARHPACRLIAVSGADEDRVLQRLSALGIDGVFPRASQSGAVLSHVVRLLPLHVQYQPAALSISAHVSRALDYVGANYQRGLTVARVATAIGVSPGHLAHLLRDFADLPFSQYLAKVRVDIAKRLLRAADAGLDGIAEQCGFCDAPHLSRVFRCYAGLWPGAYRRTVAPDHAARP